MYFKSLIVALIYTYYVSDLTAMCSATNIRIITFNIRHGLNMDNEINLTRIADVINLLNPDLVALQEVDNNTNRTGKVDQLNSLAQMTDMNQFFASAMSYDGGNYGNGVLTCWPIVYNLSYHLPRYSNESEPRAAAVVGVNITGKEITFVATHLDAKSDPNNRLLQVNALSELPNLLSETYAYDAPLIIGGDFNAKPDSQEIINMRTNFTDLTENFGNTFPSDKPNRKIDYIFLYEKSVNNFSLLDGQVIPNSIASDHRPVIVDLQINF